MKSTRRPQLVSRVLLAALVAATAGCSTIEGAGRWTRETGESWENYSKQNDGVWASIAGFGGKVNKAVGGGVESMAKDDAAPAAEQKPAAATSQRASMTSSAPAAASAPSISPAPAASSSVTVAPVAAINAPLPAPTQSSVNARAQVRLQELGYNVGKPDGVIGARTRAAIQEYQRKKGLQITGSLDPATLAALGLGGRGA